MTREQAINYLICRGITEYQVSEIVRALTYKPRDCANCKHYIVKDTRTNWGSQETTKIYGCERWECEYEPTTKNNLGVDDEERELALMYLEQIKEDYIEGVGYERHPLPEYYAIETAIKSLAMPSITQEPRKGHWIPRNAYLLKYKCSECNYKSEKYNFCPNCGAKMESEVDNGNDD